jgi:hypothetical protein
MAFTFRQRAGKLNWKMVSAVNVDNVIENSDTVELQSVIDIITFSEFMPADVKANTVESTSKLVNIMQLVIEYLLYCQESQYRLVQIQQEKNATLKQKLSVYKRELAVVEEDNKIYQRQLSLLRKSLTKSQNYIGQPSNPKVIFGGDGIPKGVDNSNETTKPYNALIDTIMQHEKDNREFLKSLLDDQRSTFFSEMSKISRERDLSSFRENTSNNYNKDGEQNPLKKTEEAMTQMTSRLCNQIETLLQTTIATMSESSMKLVNSVSSMHVAQATPARVSSVSAATTISKSIEGGPALKLAATPARVSTTSTATTTSKSIEGGQELTLAASLLDKEDQINDLSATLASERQAMDAERRNWERVNKQMQDNIQRLTVRLHDVTGESNEDAEELRRRCRKLTLSVLCKSFMSGMTSFRDDCVTVNSGAYIVDVRKQRMYFSHWMKVIMEMRSSDQSRDHSRLINSLNNSKERKERELVAQLTTEREKVARLQDELESSRQEFNKMTAVSPKLVLSDA